MIDTNNFIKMEDHLEEKTIEIQDPKLKGITYCKKIRIIGYSEPIDNSYYIEKTTGKRFKNIPTTYITNIDDDFNSYPEGKIVEVDIDKMFERVYYERESN